MKVKKFSHIQHLVSHVEGILDKKYDSFDAFRAVFPAGTISGAPKIRAMEIINDLEPESRGPYAGAVGYFSFNQSCDFAITIRSIFFNKKKGIYAVWGGNCNRFSTLIKNIKKLKTNPMLSSQH